MLKTIEEKAYGKYQLEWLMEHGYSLEDIYKVFKEAEEKYNDKEDVLEVAKEYFKEQGFDGNIFSCLREFLNNEYTDVEHMYALLSKDEFFEYLKARGFEAFERFTVENDGTVIISESNYMTDNSVTDNPDETSRIAECSGATFNLNNLTGNQDADDCMIEGVFSNCKEYIADVTDRCLFERVYEWFSRDDVHVGDYCDKNLNKGEYIKLF